MEYRIFSRFRKNSPDRRSREDSSSVPFVRAGPWRNLLASFYSTLKPFHCNPCFIAYFTRKLPHQGLEGSRRDASSKGQRIPALITCYPSRNRRKWRDQNQTSNTPKSQEPRVNSATWRSRIYIKQLNRMRRSTFLVWCRGLLSRSHIKRRVI